MTTHGTTDAPRAATSEPVAYCTAPTHFRVALEDGEWQLDMACDNPETNYCYTEEVWPFKTFKGAIEGMPDMLALVKDAYPDLTLTPRKPGTRGRINPWSDQ